MRPTLHCCSNYPGGNLWTSVPGQLHQVTSIFHSQWKKNSSSDQTWQGYKKRKQVWAPYQRWLVFWVLIWNNQPQTPFSFKMVHSPITILWYECYFLFSLRHGPMIHTSFIALDTLNTSVFPYTIQLRKGFRRQLYSVFHT